jgi:hypothetical protein
MLNINACQFAVALGRVPSFSRGLGSRAVFGEQAGVVDVFPSSGQKRIYC